MRMKMSIFPNVSLWMDIDSEFDSHFDLFPMLTVYIILTR